MHFYEQIPINREAKFEKNKHDFDEDKFLGHS